MHSWLKSYLSNRMQYVSLNSCNSTKVSCGVPHGSVLGPLLFLFYINDIYNSVPGGKIKLSADDTNLFIAAKSVSELEVKADLHLSKINKWLGANGLHLNTDYRSYSGSIICKENLSTVQLQLAFGIYHRRSTITLVCGIRHILAFQRLALNKICVV